MACTPFIWIHYHFNTFEGHETLRHARLAGRVTLQCGDDRRTKGCLGPALRSDQPPESMVSAMFLLEHLNDLRMGEKVAIVLDGDITGLTSGQIPRRVGGDGSLCVLSRMLTLTLAGRRFSRQDRSCAGFGTVIGLRKCATAGNHDFDTRRLHLVRIAAAIVEKKTRILVTPPASCPQQGCCCACSSIRSPHRKQPDASAQITPETSIQTTQDSNHRPDF
jgi:hypothetical protein